MGAGRRGELPQDLARARSQFQAWRGQRTGRRIPQRLWDLAVRLVNRHGVSRTAAALGLDYYSLKKRADSAAREPESSCPAFVELPAPVVLTRQCQLELDNDRLFTWWAPWRNLRQRNIGWRLDYVLASKPIASRVQTCVVQREFGTSDHGPVVMTYQ